jgi:uncharacterized membrane protein YqiK
MVSDTVLIAAILPIMMAVAMIAIFAARYKRVPEGMAMVVYGRQMRPGHARGYMILKKGGKFIIPIVESYEYLHTNPHDLRFDLSNVRTYANGEERKVHVKANAIVRIDTEDKMLNVAAEHLMHKMDGEIEAIARNTIEAEMRTLLRGVAFKELDADRDRTAKRLEKVCAQILMNVGLVVEHLTIHEMVLRGKLKGV